MTIDNFGRNLLLSIPRSHHTKSQNGMICFFSNKSIRIDLNFFLLKMMREDILTHIYLLAIPLVKLANCKFP